jgi:hypothetical protein
LELDSEEVNRPVLSTTILDDIEKLVEQDRPNAFTILMSSALTGGGVVFDIAPFKYQRGPSLSDKQKKRKANDIFAMESQATSSKKLSATFLQHRAIQTPTLILSQQESRSN